MHLQTSLILAIASSALALPAVNQTGSNLAKRFDHGWIGSFEDEQCSGKPVGPRPEIHLDDCIAFTPSISAGFVGIFFGTGVYDFDQLTVYADNNCEILIGVDGSQLFKETYTTGNFGCMSYQDFGVFGSIQTA